MNIPQKIADIEAELAELKNELKNVAGDERRENILNQRIIAKESQLVEYVKRLPFPAPQQGKFASNLLSHLA